MADALTYRAMTADEPLDAAARSIALAFGRGVDGAAGWIERSGRSAMRLIESGGELGGTLMLVPLGQYFGGRSVPMAGIVGVTVTPESRGRGIATWAMERALWEAREAGTPLSALYSARGPLYRRVGYEFAGLQCEHRLPLARIEIEAGDDADARVRGYEPADFEGVSSCYRRYAARHNGHLDRGSSAGAYVWDRVINGRTEAPVYGFVVEERGEITGYVFYLHVPPHMTEGAGRVLAAPDVCASTPGAARRLLAFMAEHKSVQRELWWFGSLTHPLLGELRDQVWSTKVMERWMVRVVDVPGALRARGYAQGVEGELTIRVRDELFPENAGPWSLHVGGSEGVVEPGATGGEIEMGVRALAALYSGYESPSALAARGRLTGDERAIRVADAVFAGPMPTMVDMF
ncbi:MAG: GNAT family N-acetyltransferase [Phycisphaerales bacterium]